MLASKHIGAQVELILSRWQDTRAWNSPIYLRGSPALHVCVATMAPCPAVPQGVPQPCYVCDGVGWDTKAGGDWLWGER